MKIFYIIILTLLLFQCIAKDEAESNSTEPPYSHPLSIESLRNREYRPSLITIEKTVAELKTHTKYIVSYISGGLKVYALMNVPVGSKRTYPAVIINHGYIPPDRYSTVDSYKAIADHYAKNGFLVLKPDYRGHDKSEGRAAGPLRTIYYSIDVLHLIASLGSLTNWDKQNIFLYGPENNYVKG